jgi:hypothetical protein
MKLFIWLVIFCFGSFLASPSSVPGSIEGFVTGNGGAPLAGVKITIHSITGDINREITTPASGLYAFDSLRPGAYSICAEAEGYGCIIYPNVPVGAGDTVHKDFQFATTKRKGRSCEPPDSERTR